MYYTVYKITNSINDKVYIGIHQTINLDDGYMGSGTLIKRSIKKHGVENFTKEYLAIFDNRDAMLAMETVIVDDSFVSSKTTYNIANGGYNGASQVKGRVTVKDKNNNTFSVLLHDPRYLSGELHPVAKGNIVLKDAKGQIFYTTIDDPRYLSGELLPTMTGRLTVRDVIGKTFSVLTTDPRYLSGELVSASKGYVTVKDSKGDFF